METRKKLLICDDEEGVRESLKLIFEDSYDLTFAENGVQAIEKVKSENPALMILDIKMPKVNGFETLREIKKLSPSIKVIIASGYKSVETAQEAMKLGASDYVVKPFESDEIKSIASRLVS